MVVGFNHNFSYKGELYHIQTEDSGVKSPHIITLLYRGGTILASKKTSYADIIKVDGLEQVVEDLMKEQHREMLRRLKQGEFDQLLGITPVAAASAVPAAAPATPASAPDTATAAPAPTVLRPPVPPVPPLTTATVPSTPQEKKPAAVECSLDEIILSYMVGEDRNK